MHSHKLHLKTNKNTITYYGLFRLKRYLRIFTPYATARFSYAAWTICSSVTRRRTLVDLTHRLVEPAASYASRFFLNPLALTCVTLSFCDAIFAIDVAWTVDATWRKKCQVLAAVWTFSFSWKTRSEKFSILVLNDILIFILDSNYQGLPPNKAVDNNGLKKIKE